jgi:hypothetical protein
MNKPKTLYTNTDWERTVNIKFRDMNQTLCDGRFEKVGDCEKNDRADPEIFGAEFNGNSGIEEPDLLNFEPPKRSPS